MPKLPIKWPKPHRPPTYGPSEWVGTKEQQEELAAIKRKIQKPSDPPIQGDLFKESFAPLNQDTQDNLAVGGVGLGTLTAVKGLHDAGNIASELHKFDTSLDPHREALLPHNANVDPVEAQAMVKDYITGARSALNKRLLGVRAGNIVKGLKHVQGGIGGLGNHLGYHISHPGQRGVISGIPKAIGQGAYGDKSFEHHYDMFLDKKTTMDELLKHEYQLEDLSKFSPEERSIIENSDLSKSPAGLKHLMMKLKANYPVEGENTASSFIKNKLLGINQNLEDPGIVQKIMGDRKNLQGFAGTYRKTFTPAANLLSKARIPAAILGTALTGTALINKFQHQNKEADDKDLSWELPTAGVGGLAVGAGVKNYVNPNRNIGVTYGEMTKNLVPNGANIGGGHRGPGEALFELLQQEQKSNPEAAKFNISKIIRNEAGNIDTHKLKPSYNAIVDTGLGTYMPTGVQEPTLSYKIKRMLGGVNPFNTKNTPFFNVNAKKELYGDFPTVDSPVSTKSRIGVMTDAAAEGKLLDNTTIPHVGADRKLFLHYGNNLSPEQQQYFQGHGIRTQKTNDFLTPLLKQKALDTIEGPTPNREEVINSLKETFRGRPQAQQLEGILPEDKILTISGSARGDYVASRAKEISERLKARGITNVKILAQMAQAANDPIQMKMLEGLDNVIAIPSSSPKDFIGAQQIADRHSASTGTSSLSETLGQKTPVTTPTNNNWGYSGNGQGVITDHERVAGGHAKYLREMADKEKGAVAQMKAEGRPLEEIDKNLLFHKLDEHGNILEDEAAKEKAIIDQMRAQGHPIDQSQFKYHDFGTDGKAWPKEYDIYKANPYHHAQVNTSEWNEGNMQLASRMMGVKANDSPDAIIDSLINNETNAKDKLQAAARSKLVLGDIHKGRSNMVKSIMEEAVENVKRQKLKGKWQAALGLGGIGAAGWEAYRKLHHPSEVHKTSEDESSDPTHTILGVGETGAGALGLRSSLKRVLGKKILYHGTSNDAWKKIKTEGLDPVQGGASHGSSAIVDSPHYKENSKGFVHLGPRMVASAHANLAEHGKKDLGHYMRGAMAGAIGLKGKGKIIPVSIPYDDYAPIQSVIRKTFLDQIRNPKAHKPIPELNKEYGPAKFRIDPDLPIAIKTPNHISPKQFGYRGLFHDLGRVPGYAAKHPGRFGLGLGLAGAGGYGIYDGIKRITTNPVEKESFEKEDMFTKKEIGDVNTYILGKDELEKPRNLTEEEKKRIHHRKLTGWTWNNPIESPAKMDVTQLIQNPGYRAGFDALTESLAGGVSGAQLGLGLSSFILKNPTFRKSLVGAGVGAVAGTLPSALSIIGNYKKQKLYNNIAEEFVKHHPEGQIASMPDVIKEMVDKPKTVKELKLINKKIVKKSEEESFMDDPFFMECMRPAMAMQLGLGGVNSAVQVYKGIHNFSNHQKELDDLKDRFEQKMKKKREAEVFLTKVKTPLYKKHHGQEEKIKAFDEMFKTSADTDKQPLLEHQKRVVERLSHDDQPGLVVYHGLGSGKTRTSIEAYKELGLPMEVIPPAALVHNYKKEMHKWVGKDPKDVEYVTQQLVARNGLDEHASDGKLMVIDEAHRLRNEETKLYKNLKTQHPAKRLLLTGSPVYNHPSDVSKLINLASGKDILPERQAEFEKEYIGQRVVFPTFVHRILGVRPGQEQYIKNPEYLRKVFQKMIDYNGGDTEGYPEVKEETVKVPMGEDQQKIYKTLMKSLPWYLRLKVSAGLPPDKKELDRLIPFLSGARMISNTSAGFKKDEKEIQSPKIDKAVEFLKQKLQEDPDYKGVVYSNYLDSGVNEYKKKLDEAKIPYGMFTGNETNKVRNQNVKDYNDNKLKVLLLTGAGGEGIDLKSSRILQILEPHFNNPRLDQVQGRIARYLSHSQLPKEKQNVLVQRYLSTVNPGLLDKIRHKKPTSSDEYLQSLSDQKTQLNNEFIKLMKNP